MFVKHKGSDSNNKNDNITQQGKNMDSIYVLTFKAKCEIFLTCNMGVC